MIIEVEMADVLRLIELSMLEAALLRVREYLTGLLDGLEMSIRIDTQAVMVAIKEIRK